MKLPTVLIALIAVQYALAAQGTPVATSYCMGNTDNSVNCGACYNWGPGTVGGKQKSGNLCTAALTNKITDCKIYSGSGDATIQLYDCSVCDGKDWLNLTDNANAASRIRACSDTALNATTCAAKVSNCEQSLCFKDTSNVYHKGCSMCESGYVPSGTRLTINTAGNMWYSACSTGAITNAELYSGVNALHAYTCKSSYAVANDNLSCAAFTTDSNCRKLGSGAWCGECWYSYYFDTTTCKLAAGLMAVGGIVMAALTMF